MNRGMALIVCCAGLGLTGCSRSSVSMNPEAETSASAEAKTSAETGGDFAFPADTGGKLLSQLLPPSEQEASQLTPPLPEPRAFPDPAAGLYPELALPKLVADLPPAALVFNPSSIRPRSLPEEPPFTRSFEDPLLPGLQALPVARGIRVPSEDVEQPPPLPILAQAQVDRVSLEDPTSEVSLAVVLATVMPLRMTPVPFQRWNLPDPFEHRQAARLRTSHPDTQVPLLTPRPPRR